MDYRNKLLQGDCLEVLRQLPDNTFHCCISSPPYFALRDYGVEGQIGLEATPREYIDKMVAVYREVRRVLRADGTGWINIGDSYAGGGGYCPDAPSNQNSSLQSKGNRLGERNIKGMRDTGIAPKNLLLIPQRLAIALQDDGWIVRSIIIWQKQNPMPESVQDRPTTAHEYVLLITKKPRYWYDADAVREPQKEFVDSPNQRPKAFASGNSLDSGFAHKKGGFNDDRQQNGIQYNPLGRNLRTVWTIPSEGSDLPHYAMFPRKLITPMILAGCPRNCCAVCGAGYVREVEVSGGTGKSWHNHKDDLITGQSSLRLSGDYQCHDRGFHPACDCRTHDTTPGLVLDMFAGTGTTGLVARDYGRDYTLIELSPEYVDIARKRLDMPFTLPLPIDS